jgi:hypothetical protein
MSLLQKTISVFNAHTGEFLGEIESVKLGRWFTKNKLQVCRWEATKVYVQPVVISR